ncbi:MAG: sodium-dependent transporter [Parvibaculales bacterium]
MINKQNTVFWNSNFTFVLACVGAAVGLGNIWKFPYMTGTQGGGAFVLIYLATIFAIAIPIAVSELLIGRHGRSDAVTSVRTALQDSHYPRRLDIIGGVAVFASFVLLSFYAVIAGWVSAYVIHATQAVLGQGMLGQVDADSANSIFNDLLSAPTILISHQILFLLLIGVILVRQLQKGLERANLILIPALVIMLIGIVAYGIVAGDIAVALKFLFTPDFSKITAEVVQSAIGHGFFSVGVGAAMLITYSAYLNKNVNLGRTAIIIGLADTAIALLAGIGVFSIVFGQSLDPAQGPGLIFTTLPLAFAQMPGGSLLAFMFFLLVYFAALTSGLSLGEVIIRWAENRFSWSRQRAAIIMLGAIFLVGLATVFSFNHWADFRLVSQGRLADKTLFDTKDYLVTAYLMPLGGLGAVVLTGWLMPRPILKQIFGAQEGGFLFEAWLWSARIIAPLGIGWIFIAGL